MSTYVARCCDSLKVQCGVASEVNKKEATKYFTLTRERGVTPTDEVRKVILDYLSTWAFSYVTPYIIDAFTVNDELLEPAFRGIVRFTILVRRTT